MSQATAKSETSALIAALDDQRRHILDSLEGLSDEQMRRPALPSGWTCLGLVQHLTLDVERFWFFGVTAGNELALNEAADQAWRVAEDIPAQAVIDAYRSETERANTIIAATPLEAEPAWWPEGLFGEWRIENVRAIVLHVLTETACHTGHLDVAREMIDGRLRLVLT